jgi:hypothetical protein
MHLPARPFSSPFFSLYTSSTRRAAALSEPFHLSAYDAVPQQSGVFGVYYRVVLDACCTLTNNDESDLCRSDEVDLQWLQVDLRPLPSNFNTSVTLDSACNGITLRADVCSTLDSAIFTPVLVSEKTMTYFLTCAADYAHAYHDVEIVPSPQPQVHTLHRLFPSFGT